MAQSIHTNCALSINTPTRGFHIRTQIFILLIFAVVANSGFAQKPVILKFHQMEQQAWKGYIEGFRSFSGTSNFDVTFYHLDITAVRLT
jgi:hypothetical protein